MTKLVPWLLPVALVAACSAGSEPGPAASLSEAPEPWQRPDGQVLTNTETVEDLLGDGGALWVATQGGIERYDIASGERTRVYTTLDGLDHNHVYELERGAELVRARTAASWCELRGEHWSCEPAEGRPTQTIEVPRLYRGRRVTATLEHAGRTFVGTAGAGVWVDSSSPQRLTPERQICSNHVTDITEWQGRVWVGSFDDGLCVAEGDGFVRVPGPIRMVNDLEATEHMLFVASSEGLFSTRDGTRFEPLPDFARGAGSLGFDGESLFATTPGSLRRIQVSGPRSKNWWRPGGTSAIQDMALGPDGTVWLATEDRGAIRVQDDEVRVFDRAAGLPTSWALSIDVAPDGTAWVATLRHGLVAIAPSGEHRRVEVPMPWLLRVRAQDGQVWVGTQGGALSVAPNGTATTIAGVPDPRVHEIVRVGARRYFATESGVLVLEVQAPASAH